MGRMYSIMAADESAGTTIGTREAVNTRNGTIRLVKDTFFIPGFYFGGVANAQTTATAVMGGISPQSTDLGLVDQVYSVGETHGGGIATQSGGWASPAEFIPVDIPVPDGSAPSLTMGFQQFGIEPADNWNVVTGPAQLIGSVPGHYYDYFWAAGNVPPAGRGSPSSNGGSTTNARTSMTLRTVEGKFRELVSFRPLQSQDGVQATSEEAVPLWELTGTIDALTNVEFPGLSIGPALAGTLVGGGIGAVQPALPIYVEKDAADRTLEPFVSLGGGPTLTAANAFGWSAGARESTWQPLGGRTQGRRVA